MMHIANTPKPDRKEDRLQKRVRLYLDAALPAPGWWGAVIPEGKRSPRAGMDRKARGQKPGMADTYLTYRGLNCWIELKAGSAISESQAAFGAAMEANGNHWVVIWSVEQLDSYLRNLGVPIAASHRIEALRHDAALQIDAPATPRKAGAKPPRPKRPTAKALAVARKAYGLL